MFGAIILWPEQLMRVFQKCCILCYCKIWRQLRHRVLCNPWLASCIFNPDVEHDTKLNEANKYWNALACSLDPWICKPLVEELCIEVNDLMEQNLQTFVWTLFSRTMVTSTFVEKAFAPVIAFTCDPQSRPGLPLL